MITPANVLVLGATGMLGNAVFRFFSNSPGFVAYGSARSFTANSRFSEALQRNVVSGVDVENDDHLVSLFDQVRPNVVINCIGLVKQLAEADDVLTAVPINTLLPHKLARLCKLIDARLVHISTDCVFSGDRGMYKESDAPDAGDLYGRSKFLGEVDYPNAITLRTSIIGYELSGARSLLCWFLAQEGRVKGYSKAIFSGLPTNELARVIRDFVIPRPDLHGLYHVAAAPIDKYSLLTRIATVFGKQVEIFPDDQLVIDRSLCADRFKDATGYLAPEWPQLIQSLYEFK